MSLAIYKIEVCWFLAGTSSCQKLPMLAEGTDAEDAISNLKAELLSKPKKYKIDVKKDIKFFEVKMLDYFMFPVIAKKRRDENDHNARAIQSGRRRSRRQLQKG